MKLEVEPFGFAELRGVLAQVREHGEDMRPAMQQVADFFASEAAEVFRSRGRSAGGWEPLSEQYKKSRLPRPQGVQTGALRRSMTTKGARYHRRQVARDQVVVKSVAPHAHLYADGHGKQPARPLVRITPRTRREVAGILQRYLTGDR